MREVGVDHLVCAIEEYKVTGGDEGEASELLLSPVRYQYDRKSTAAQR